VVRTFRASHAEALFFLGWRHRTDTFPAYSRITFNCARQYERRYEFQHPGNTSGSPDRRQGNDMRTTQRWMTTAVLATLTAIAAHAQAACTFGSSGATSLQSTFDSLLAPGSLSASNDCIGSSDTLWSAQGHAAATIIVGAAGAKSGDVFGIYDPRHRKSQISIFDGSAAAGSASSIQLRPNGTKYDVFANDTFEGQFTSSTFGFFLRTPANGTLFSEARRNRDGADHMYAYAGNGAPFKDGPLDGSAFESSMYLLAFEDSRLCRKRASRARCGNADFQDFVATVNFVAPIPLPAGAPLLASALAGLAIWRRRTGVSATSN